MSCDFKQQQIYDLGNASGGKEKGALTGGDGAQLPELTVLSLWGRGGGRAGFSIRPQEMLCQGPLFQFLKHQEKNVAGQRRCFNRQC